MGAVAGVALLNKNLVVLLVAGVGAGIVLDRRWELLRSRWLVVGGVIALGIASPHLLWQMDNGWPQFEFAQALADRIGGENRLTLVPLQVVFVGPAFVFVGWRGVRWLWRAEAGRLYRPLLWAWLVVLALVFVTGGRPYYALPFTAAVVLAGLVPTLVRSKPRSVAALALLNGAFSAAFSLPLLPVSAAEVSASMNETIAETVGWPELARQIHDVHTALPTADQANAIVIAGSYGEAGAARLLPRAV